MKYLLDTHAWFWALETWTKIPRAAGRVLRDARNAPFALSAISVWELSMLVERGRIRMTVPLEKWLEQALDPVMIRLLPLTPEVAIHATRLAPAFVADPADEMIVATARVHALKIITADERMHAYPGVRTVWD